ncbi:MAG: AAA family ATPase [Deltaproteobacteria bacterium]|nr:AAA family ATPase [Deltaproteobacteria bacterium]
MRGDKVDPVETTPGSATCAAGFVGRERELTELRAGWTEALNGRTRLFLLVGEAGIGKTRLAQELADDCRRQGALVLWGTCWEDRGAPAYWPWAQVLRGLLRDPQLLPALQSPVIDVEQLSQVLPELRGKHPEARFEGEPMIERDDARFAVFDAVTSLLRRVSAEQPLVLIFDDLHAADPPSLLLLRFVSRELRDARLLILGTYRPTRTDAQAERLELIAQIGRFGRHVPLAGLDFSQVATLIEQDCASRPSAALVAAVHRITEGNPFFIDEVARLLVAEGLNNLPDEQAVARLRIPLGVREAIRERLRPLSDNCRDLLSMAAVVGREFELNVLQGVSGRGADALLDLLREASVAGVVVESRGGIGRYSFAHALFRDHLYDEQSPGERLRLHNRIGETLERVRANELVPHFAELAHHYLLAAPSGDVTKAVHYCTLAAEQAADQLAYEDAIDHYQHALQALALGTAPVPRRQCEILLGLGQAQRNASHADARETVRRAVEIARGLVRDGDPQGASLFTRTALGVADQGLGMPDMAGDAEVVRLLEEALEVLGPSDHPSRARALCRLAMECVFEPDRSRSQELSQQGVEMARRLGDPTTLAATLSMRQFVLWHVGRIADRLPISSEIIVLAEQIHHRELALQGRTWHLVDLMGSGNVHAFDAEIDTQAQYAETLRQPRYLWMTASLRCMRALWAARWNEAEDLAQRSLVLGQRTGDQQAAVSPWIQVFIIRRERGQLAQEEPMTKFFAERYPKSPVPRTFLAIIYMELGRSAEAREQFELVASEDFANLSRERRIGVLPCLAEVCAFLGDQRRAAMLRPLLQPYAHCNLPYGTIVTFGATDHYLALLSATLGGYDDAVALFEQALDFNRRMEARAWFVRTQHELARVLLARHDPGDVDRAVQLAQDCLNGAVVHGMLSLAAKTELLLERARVAARDHADRGTENKRMRAVGGGQEAVEEVGEGDKGSPVDPVEDDSATRRGRVLSFPRQARDTPAVRRRATPTASTSRGTGAGTTSDSMTGGEAIFRRDGEYWSIGDGRAMMRLKDTKGLRYIARLLRHPGREFHAADMVATEEGVRSEAVSPFDGLSSEQLAEMGIHPDSGESGPLLDARAKNAYRRRIEDLRDQLEESQRYNDIERAQRARQELEFLTNELARAVGLGGRDRPGNTQAEKARLNVTRAIKAVIKRIGEHNLILGRYLSTTIKTGAFCSYTPDPRFPIDWKL